jgi:hypothetical protein
VDHDHEGSSRDQQYRRVVARRVELDRIEARIDRPARRDHIERVAIRRRSYAELESERAARARTIVDDHLLTERFGKFLADDPRHEIGAAAGRRSDDHANRLDGIRLA